MTGVNHRQRREGAVLPLAAVAVLLVVVVIAVLRLPLSVTDALTPQLELALKDESIR